MSERDRWLLKELLDIIKGTQSYAMARGQQREGQGLSSHQVRLLAAVAAAEKHLREARPSDGGPSRAVIL